MAFMCSQLAAWLTRPFSAVITFRKQFVDDVTDTVRRQKEKQNIREREMRQRAIQFHLDKLEENYLCCVCGRSGDPREDDDAIFNTFSLLTLPPTSAVIAALSSSTASALKQPSSQPHDAARTCPETDSQHRNDKLRSCSPSPAARPRRSSRRADLCSPARHSTTAPLAPIQPSSPESILDVMNTDTVRQAEVNGLMYKIRHAILNKEARTRRRHVFLHRDKGLIKMEETDIDVFSLLFQRQVRGYLCLHCYNSARKRLFTLTRQIQLILFKARYPLLRKAPAQELQALLASNDLDATTHAGQVDDGDDSSTSRSRSCSHGSDGDGRVSRQTRHAPHEAYSATRGEQVWRRTTQTRGHMEPDERDAGRSISVPRRPGRTPHRWREGERTAAANGGDTSDSTSRPHAAGGLASSDEAASHARSSTPPRRRRRCVTGECVQAHDSARTHELVLEDDSIQSLRETVRCNICQRRNCCFFVHPSVLFLCQFCCARDRFYRDNAVCINDEPMPADCAHLLMSLAKHYVGLRRQQELRRVPHVHVDTAHVDLFGATTEENLFACLQPVCAGASAAAAAPPCPPVRLVGSHEEDVRDALGNTMVSMFVRDTGGCRGGAPMPSPSDTVDLFAAQDATDLVR